MDTLTILRPLVAMSLTLGGLYGGTVEARWMDESEAAFKVISWREDHQIAEDGTRVRTLEVTARILNDSARNAIGIYRGTYNPLTASLEVIEAETINGEERSPVDRALMQDKPVASNGEGFDNNHVLSFVFPNLNVGSNIHYIVRQVWRTSDPLSAGSVLESVGQTFPIENFEFSVRSKIPIIAKTQDPDGFLDVTSTTNEFHVRLRRPIFRQAVDEEDAILDSRSIVWIGFSTMLSLDKLPDYIFSAFEETLNSELPASLHGIFDEARRLDSAAEQIDFVSSRISDLIRYVGDWTTVRGYHVPHSLKHIVDRGYGDCKDFTVTAGAIFRRLGFEAYPLFIFRGENALITPLGWPPLQINHAMLRLRKNGQTYFVDATNDSTFGGRIYKDVADRPAAVLRPGRPELIQTPPLTAVGSLWERQTTIEFDPTYRKMRVSGKWKLDGLDAVDYTGVERAYSHQLLTNNFIKGFKESLSAGTGAWKVGPYDFSSRIVSSHEISFTFEGEFQTLKTSRGTAYVVKAPQGMVKIFTKAIAANSKRVTSLNIGEPGVVSKKVTLRGASMDADTQEDCAGSSPWVDYRRHLSRTDADELTLVDEYTVKTHAVPPEEVNSAQFAQFASELRGCFQDFAMIIENKKAVNSVPPQ